MNNTYLWNLVKGSHGYRLGNVRSCIQKYEHAFLTCPELRKDIALKICWEAYERNESGLFNSSIYEIWIMYGVNITPDDWAAEYYYECDSYEYEAMNRYYNQVFGKEKPNG